MTITHVIEALAIIGLTVLIGIGSLILYIFLQEKRDSKREHRLPKWKFKKTVYAKFEHHMKVPRKRPSTPWPEEKFEERIKRVMENIREYDRALNKANRKANAIEWERYNLRRKISKATVYINLLKRDVTYLQNKSIPKDKAYQE